MVKARHNVRAERPTRYSDNTSSLGKSGRIPGPLQRVLGEMGLTRFGTDIL
jgi:hypothetical protein